MVTLNTSHGPADYQIKVKGQLGDQWSVWFTGATIKSEDGVTILTVRQIDQSGLHGLLVRIRDVGLPLISLQRI